MTMQPDRLLAFIDALLEDERTTADGILTMLRAEGMGFTTAHDTHVRLPFNVVCGCPE